MYRRRGIARALLIEAEDAARAEGKTLLTLDMPEGDPSNAFERSAGDVEASWLPAGGATQAAGSSQRTASTGCPAPRRHGDERATRLQGDLWLVPAAGGSRG
jgi:GNAT superfamily N-acetyltransferase